ncbi:hydrogenase-2 component protein [Salmonella enterica subsp. enterica]|uniref:Hydrogenase-2 component protein n=1 Tax=Salmonella enterica I TaxID=59201 RepID=A0A379UUW0_SALET|nr:hydrogenase-2 component protein [Salmonella enterica subsp. enterica]
MCIGVPGQVLAVGDDIHQLAQVEVCGIKRDVNIALICEGKASRSDRAMGIGTRWFCDEHH